MSFPCDGKEKEWHLTEQLAGELSALFPALDVMAQARLALAWVQAAPDRRKTSRGMRRFITGWLTRTQERGGARAAAPFLARESRDDRLAKLFDEKGDPL
jgi:hypothetical protein